MKKLLQNLWNRIKDLRRDARGFVLMSTLAIFLFLFVLCASIYAVGETIHQRIKLQNACDAAAYSAAVVQADGLSRMATVNRAMAWTYVQMTNRQMDYITCRWLKLTCKRFNEDKENAEAYAAQMIFALDKELGWWAILEAALTAPISVLLDDTCDSGGGHSRENEGHSWWCGTGENAEHHIDLNTPNGIPESISDGLERVAGSVVNMLTTYELISAFVNSFPEALLGELIDSDKNNIAVLNKTLSTINTQMNISMRVTAENVLKNMLKDDRLSKKELEDYYISIHIPSGENPYGDMKDVSAVPKSYFSPMHNTEAEEMLFLGMGKTQSATLPEHFPTFPPPPQKGGYGLDQWFIRGRGIYVAKSSAADEKVTQNAEHCFAKQTASSFDGKSSGAVDGNVRLYGTERSEGALGIQRVYKDANLNEGRAGFFGKLKRTIKEEVWIPQYELVKDKRAEVRKQHLDAAPKCCRTNAKKRSAGRSWRIIILAHMHEIEKVLIKEPKYVITRGNHLISLTDLLEDAFNKASDFFSGNSTEENSNEDQNNQPENGEIIVDNEEDLKKQLAQQESGLSSNIENSKAENSRLQTENQKLREQLNGTTDASERDRINAAIKQNEGKIKNNETNITNWNTELADLNRNSSILSNGPQKSNGAEKGIENWRTSQGGGNVGSYYNKNSPGGFLQKLISAVVEPLLGSLLDIAPSCDNLHRDYDKVPMCTMVNDTTALYADYRWASAKWFCVTKFFTWAVCTIFREKIWCDTDTKTKKIGFIKIRCKGKGHYHYPKMFCGARPRYALDYDWYNDLLAADPTGWARKLAEPLPPLIENIEGSKHGYMTFAMDFRESGFLRPILPLFGKKTTFERDEFESCAMFPDGNFIVNRGEKAHAALIRGHARIYGDDKEIFDNRYVGAICKPWVLNERFFSGEGTIYVGAAMKHVNPFVRLFSMLGDNVTQENNDKTIFSAFNVPQRKYGKKSQFYYMWTMSAARAGVRHTRRGGHYDQPRKYQVVYDPTSDPENLFYNGKPLVYSPEDKAWHSVTNGQVMNWDDPDNPNALTRTNLEKQSHAAIWDGCPCGVSSMQLIWNWNLCETDWDATLLPVRFSGAKALLFHSVEHKNGKKIEKSYNSVDKTARETYIYQSPEFQRCARTEQNKNAYEANSLGSGTNWVWEDPDFITFGNPYLVGIWKPAADQIYLPIPGAATPSTRVSLNLDGKIPEGKDTKKVNLYYLWRGKWL